MLSVARARHPALWQGRDARPPFVNWSVSTARNARYNWHLARCGPLDEASLGAPGTLVRINVRSYARTGFSGRPAALAYRLPAQPRGPISSPERFVSSPVFAPRLILAGCFCHVTSAVEPFCAVGNLPRRVRRDVVGMGAVLAAKAPGAGSSGFQSCRRDLLRSL